ncbi:MAG: HPr family phosphocarrier protein [Spirochaetaceae bacterium]|jgi:phosphocarrier protein|nr:HPr family phosphocarrier protein [Spirochaetaceae bacterium]
MKTFDYVIKDAVGIHARPAGFLVKAAKEYESEVTLTKQPDKKADLKRYFEVMKLGVKCGDAITITATGADEEQAIAAVEKVLVENL